MLWAVFFKTTSHVETFPILMHYISLSISAATSMYLYGQFSVQGVEDCGDPRDKEDFATGS